MNLIKIITIFLFSISIFALTAEEERKYDELEGFSLIKSLYKDKKYSDIIKYSSKMNVLEEEKGDFNFFVGDSFLNLKQLNSAEKHFNLAENYKVSELSLLNLSLAKLKSDQSKYVECVERFEFVNKWILKYEDWKLYTTCMEKSNQIEKIISTYLSYNISDFDFILEAQRVLIKYGLRNIAKEKREQLFDKCRNINDYLNMFNLLDENKIEDFQMKEIAHRCHPKSLEISSHLIKSMFTQNQNHSVAFAFFEMSLEDALFRKHTSEFYKVANRSDVAFYFSTIADENSYVLSRAEKYLNKDNMALLNTIQIPNYLLKSNKDLAYAKAYAALKYLRLNEVDLNLKSIAKSGDKESQLANLLKQCKTLDYKCRP